MTIAPGNVAVITGAAGGIGAGLARACLAKDMRVLIADLDEARVQATAAELRESGGDVVGTTVDVSDAASVAAMRDSALDAFGQVDLLCNNAGLGLVRSVLNTTDADWQRLIDVNLWGVIHGIRTFLPLFTEVGAGHINATSSLSGLVADPDIAIYDATKFAVVGMVESVALEMHRDHPGVTCSVLCPGPVATDLMTTSGAHLEAAGSQSLDDEANNEIAEYLAAGQHPDDIGRFAIDGIAAGKFWLLSHGDYTFEITDPRYEAMKQGQLYIAPDWVESRE